MQTVGNESHTPFALDRGRGSPRLGIRTLALVGAILSALLTAGAATAAKPKPAPKNAAVLAGSQYLALGDSYTFGYVEVGVAPTPNYQDPSSLQGFPELLASELHLRVANAACPGETTASMINRSAQSNYCENNPGNPSVDYRRAFPLHVRYQGSQLAYALSYLHAHHDVRLVSLMIGGDDALICAETTSDGCSSPSEQIAVVQTVTRNIHVILRAIRQRAHYRGQLVIVNYFSPLIFENSRVILLNQAIDAAAKPFGVLVADGYSVFQAADRHSGGNPCVAGLLTQLATGGCGIHPSYAGQTLLAQAVERVIRL